ncbi:MAG: hypothetical protein DSY36_02805, partial [Candidatus Neomarinimicrobiota bacterium]
FPFRSYVPASFIDLAERDTDNNRTNNSIGPRKLVRNTIRGFLRKQLCIDFYTGIYNNITETVYYLIGIYLIGMMF